MRISECIQWPVTWPTPKKSFLRRAGSFFEAASRQDQLTMGGPSHVGTPMTARGDEDAELPSDGDALVPIEQLVAEVVDGDGALHDVRMTQTAALVATPETGEVDLARAVLTRAECFEDKDPHQPAACWELTVDVDGRPVQLYGQWLSFAWLGHLAGWPPPTT